MVTKTPARTGSGSTGSGSTGRSSAGRIVPLFRPYRIQVAGVVVLIVVTSTIGIINPLLIQAVFNKALFVPGGPNLHLLYVLAGIMALVPVVNGAIGILQAYEATGVGQLVMRDLRNRLYAHLETLRFPSSPTPRPARSSPGWPTTWAASRQWSPTPPRRSWPTSSPSSPASSPCSSSAGS